ncbi:branched-chain amino acid transport system II carrier protein [Bacillus paranthracis]
MFAISLMLFALFFGAGNMIFSTSIRTRRWNRCMDRAIWFCRNRRWIAFIRSYRYSFKGRY